jgi:hypothetical protein
MPTDLLLLEEDVLELHHAIRANQTDDLAMIHIVALRGDSHLREVMRLYENTYRPDFARELLKKTDDLIVSHLTSNPATGPGANLNLGKLPCIHSEWCNQPSRSRRAPHSSCYERGAS